MGRRRFTREFKQQAVQRVLEEDRPVTEIARELGVAAPLLHKWKQDYLAVPQPEGTPALKETPEQQIRRLRHENERLRQERDFLKKAVGFFSQERE
jgi:transposase